MVNRDRFPHRRNRENSWDEAPPWAIELKDKMSFVIRNQEKIMINVAALQAAAARLQASDTAALETLQLLKDQNVALAAQLAAIPVQDPNTQAAIDVVVSSLNGTADAVEKAVADNKNTPNLTPSPAPDAPKSDPAS